VFLLEDVKCLGAVFSGQDLVAIIGQTDAKDFTDAFFIVYQKNLFIHDHKSEELTVS
jgi:hypothetical protein